MNRLPLTVAASALILLAGCTAPAPAPSVDPVDPAPAEQEEVDTPPALIDACALLPREEAEVIAQTPLDDAVAGDPLEPSCSYTGPVEGPLAQVEIYVGDGAQKFYEIEVSLDHDFIEVPGIGDEAHLEDNTAFARVGSTWIALRLVRLNDPAENAPLLLDALDTVAGRVAAL